jgi:hypothetical protein
MDRVLNPLELAICVYDGLRFDLLADIPLDLGRNIVAECIVSFFSIQARG